MGTFTPVKLHPYPEYADGKTAEKEFASDPWIWHSIDSFSSVK